MRDNPYPVRSTSLDRHCDCRSSTTTIGDTLAVDVHIPTLVIAVAKALTEELQSTVVANLSEEIVAGLVAGIGRITSRCGVQLYECSLSCCGIIQVGSYSAPRRS